MPGKVVQGPDGKVIQFPDGMDDNAINQAMSGIYGGGPKLAAPAKPPTPPPAAPENMLTQGLSNVGHFVGGAWEAAKNVLRAPGDIVASAAPQTPAEAASFGAGGPLGMAASAAKNVFQHTVVDPLQAHAEQSRRMTAIAQTTGNPDAQHLANMHAIASGVPILGPMAANLVQRWMLGDKYGALGEGAGYVAAPEVTAKALSTELPGSPLRGTPQQSLSRAIGAKGTTPFRESIDIAKPDLDQAAATNPVKTPQDLQKVVKIANDNINNEFDTALKPIAKQETVPISVADTIKSEIKPGMMKTADGRAVAAVLKRRALEFENQKWTWSELNDERMAAYARLKPFTDASAEAQAAMTKSGRANLLADRAILEATRDAVYEALDQYHNKNLPEGQTPYDFSALKRRQAALLDIKFQLDKEVPTLENATDVLKGSGFLERGHMGVYGHPESGKVATSIHNLQNIFSTPESRAGTAAQRAFPTPSTSQIQAPRNIPGMNLYPTPQSIMLGMKTGELDQAEGARLLQRLRRSASAGPTRRLPAPEVPPAP